LRNLVLLVPAIIVFVGYKRDKKLSVPDDRFELSSGVVVE